MYRVKFAKGTGGVSWGDWKYYENDARGLDSMRADLLDAYLDIDSGSRAWSRLRFAHAWIRARKEINGAERTWKYKNIFAVEKLVNDEWTPVAVEFIRPEVNIVT